MMRRVKLQVVCLRQSVGQTGEEVLMKLAD
jgi:hypothetical protein